MDESLVLTIIAVTIPLTATIVIWASAADMAERHHRHHDTYQMAHTLSWSLVFAMIFMGTLGVLLGWLCMVGAFNANASSVLAFFDAFLVVSFVYWLMLRHYKVVTYDERLEVTPFIGRTVTIPYEDISLMRWVPSIMVSSGRSIHIFVGHRRRALLWSGLDLEQILISINRFDVLESTAD